MYKACRYLTGLVLSVFIAGCFSGQDESEAGLYTRSPSTGMEALAPVRGQAGLLRLHRDGDTYECSMCHEGFREHPDTDPLMGEHSDIVFTHGLERHCLHCHHPKNSDAYVDHDGSELPGYESTQLCGKCHGVILKDWTVGVHGRQNGYWSEALGPRRKLKCIQCHDPHNPAFPGLKPDPPPIRSRFGLERSPSKQEPVE